MIRVNVIGVVRIVSQEDKLFDPFVEEFLRSLFVEIEGRFRRRRNRRRRHGRVDALVNLGGRKYHRLVEDAEDDRPPDSVDVETDVYAETLV